jgi:hypothetical protein
VIKYIKNYEGFMTCDSTNSFMNAVKEYSNIQCPNTDRFELGAEIVPYAHLKVKGIDALPIQSKWKYALAFAGLVVMDMAPLFLPITKPFVYTINAGLVGIGLLSTSSQAVEKLVNSFQNWMFSSLDTARLLG